MTEPLIESTRLQFSGLSAEEFEDVPGIGDTRVYTVRTRCISHNEQEMAGEGIRKSSRMKIVQVLSGVDKTIEDLPAPEPSLFDQPTEPNTDNGPDGESSEFEGPAFSAGER